MASADSVRTAFAEIEQHHGKIDVLVNNAAIYEPSFVKDATDQQINSALMTNFAGPVLVAASRTIPTIVRATEQVSDANCAV